MAIDYQLHENVNKKLEQVTAQELDLIIREKKLAEDKKKLERERLDFIQDKTHIEEEIKLKETLVDKKLRVIATQESEALNAAELVGRERKKLDIRSELLQKKEQDLDKTDNQIKIERKKLDEERAQILKVSDSIKPKLAEADDKLRVAETKLSNVREAENKSQKILINLEKKNKEVDAKKIKVGIRERQLEKITQEQERQTIKLKDWEERNIQVSHELEVKRKLLSSAYSKADLDTLNTKVAQELGVR